MQLVNRKTITRVSALILVLMLVLSSTACLAASFKKSAAGVKYGGKTFKLGATVTLKQMKNAFGSSVKTGKVAPCDNMPYGGKLYKFASKGITIETRYKSAKKTSEQIISITLTKSTVPTIAGLKVGASSSKIKDLYGKKCYKLSSDQVFYTNGNPNNLKYGDYILDIFTKRSKNSKGKTVRKISRIMFSIN